MNTTTETISDAITNIVDQACEATDPTAAELALVELVDDYNADTVAAFVECHGKGYYPLDKADEWADTFRDAFVGKMTMREYAEQLVDDGVFGAIPDTLTYYIDYDAIAHDLSVDTYEQDGYLFRAI